MNKKKFFKKSGIFLGIASAIVTIPSVVSVVTASKTNNDVSSRTNNLVDNNPGITNYKGGGTKNNESINYDDILNGANKASYTNPVYAFDENNNLVVPNINESYYNELQNTNSYVSDYLQGDYFSNIVIDIPNSNLDINSLKDTLINSKQKSLENSLSKFSDEQLNSVITLTDNQKKWINYLIPNNNINLDDDFVLKDFITQITDSSFAKGQSGNLNVANAVNSLSAFGINLDEEKDKLLGANINGSSNLSDILNNNGSYNNVLYGGGGASPSTPKQPNISNNTNVVIPPSANENSAMTIIQLYNYLKSLTTLTTISVTISAVQLVVDLILYVSSWFINVSFLFDAILEGVSIGLGAEALDEYSQDIKKINIDCLDILVKLINIKEGVKISLEFIAKNYYSDIKEFMKVFGLSWSAVKGFADVLTSKSYSEYMANVQKFMDYIDSFKNWLNTPKVSAKFISCNKVPIAIRLSLVSQALTVVSAIIDATIIYVNIEISNLKFVNS